MNLSTLSLRAFSYVEERQSIFQIMHAEFAWREARGRFIKLQPGCQMCGAQKELQVHHVYPWHLFPALRFELNNLVTLCQPCHFRFGHFRDWKGFNIEILELCEIAQARNKTVDWQAINSFKRIPILQPVVLPPEDISNQQEVIP